MLGGLVPVRRRLAGVFWTRGRKVDVHWGEPHDVDSQVFYVVNFGDYARNVA